MPLSNPFVNVLLPVAVDVPFTYSVPEGMPVPALGSYVQVPFRGKTCDGVVWEVPQDPPKVKLKSIQKVYQLPPMAGPLRKMVGWLAGYTLAPQGMALKLALSAPDALEMKKPPRAFPVPDPAFAPATLGDGQADACHSITKAQGFQPFLLDGVTGSGKTEVYFEAVAEVVRRGQQAVILLPEIALSTQMLGRFAARFGCPPALWHSALTPAVRRDTWRAVAEGQVKVVLGARSALFLPFKSLGLIVVDEEHDGSYKQDDGIAYQARDMAVVRAREEGIPVVLASATPSLESLVNVEAGRYRRLHLPERHAGAEYPPVTLVDLRKDRLPPGKWLSSTLVRAARETLERGEQVLFFLNRRGYAPLTLCRTCGHRWQCPNCTAWQVAHRASHKLQCHHCGTQSPWPTACPACAATDSLTACGPGVERLAEEAAHLFPTSTLVQVSSDTMSSRTEAETLLARISSGEANILVGTQIVAKGYHFPNLTLVGVVDADMGLSGGDLRAAEKTWQMLHQVAGRAGRAEKPGRVFLQTFLPEHPVMQTLCRDDRAGFLQCQLAERQPAQWPPFGRLAAVVVSATDEGLAQDVARKLSAAVPVQPGIIVLGPAPAPLFRLQGRCRFRFLVKTGRKAPLQSYLRQWLAAVPVPSAARVQVDVDPYNFL